jgi:hypothetical protein
VKTDGSDEQSGEADQRGDTQRPPQQPDDRPTVANTSAAPMKQTSPKLRPMCG